MKPTNLKIPFLIASALATITLGGCGGSSSNSPPPGDGGGPPPPPPVTSVDFGDFVHMLLADTSDTSDPADVNGVMFTFDDDPASFDDVIGGP